MTTEHDPETCKHWDGGWDSCPPCARYWEDIAIEYQEDFPED